MQIDSTNPPGNEIHVADYGRGTLDDKSDLVAAMMTMVELKRLGTPLDRDVVGSIAGRH